MNDGTTPRYLDSGEYFDRLKRRWQPLAWAILALGMMGSPIYCATNMANESKVRFAKIEGRIDSLEKGNKHFQKSLDKLDGKVDDILKELRSQRK